MTTSSNGKERPYILINDTYVVGDRLGQGSFGEVYFGVHKWSNRPVAIKLEPLEAKTRILEHEYNVYRHIYLPNSGIGRCHYYGIEGDFAVLVIDLMGRSLGSLFKYCNYKFSLKTTLMIGDQMIHRLEYLHDCNFIHRDLKPDNMLIGKSNQKDRIHLIDYGLAKKYFNKGKHIPYRTGGKLVGTARYASVNSHLGYQLSRRDDMISLVYILIYFIKGRLPWQDAGGKTKEEKYDNIKRMKQNLTPTQICEGLPTGFQELLETAQAIEFNETPDYNKFKQIIKRMFNRNNLTYDLVFDWTPKKQPDTT